MATTSWNKRLAATVGKLSGVRADTEVTSYPGSKFSDLPTYKSLRNWESVGSIFGVKSPFFRTIEEANGNFTTIKGEEKLNFAWCDYLGLNQHPAVAQAMKDAIDRFGPVRRPAGWSPVKHPCTMNSSAKSPNSWASRRPFCSSAVTQPTFRPLARS